MSNIENFTHPEVLEDHHELRSILLRLDRAEKDFTDKKAAHDNKYKDHPNGPKPFKLGATTYGCIAAYHFKGQWHTPPKDLLMGKEFKAELGRILDFKPNKIKIELYDGKKSDSPSYSKTFTFTEEGKTVEPPPKHETDNQFLGELQNIKADLDTLKKTPAIKDGNPNTELIVQQANFEAKIERLTLINKHQDEVRELKREIEKKDDYIAELEEEIDELNEELEDQESDLAGFEGKLKEKKEVESSWGYLLQKTAEKAVIGLAKNHTNTLGAIFGVEPEELKKALSKDEKFNQLTENSSNANAGSASFSESTDEWGNMTEEEKQYKKIVFNFIKEMPLEDFRIIYTIFSELQNPESKRMEVEKMQKTLQFIFQLNGKAAATSTETTPTE